MSSRHEDGLLAMLIQLEPVVRDRIRAEAARDPAFATTRAVVVADTTTKSGRLFATNVLRENVSKDAIATVAAVDLTVLRDAFSGDDRVLEMMCSPPKPGFVLLVAVGEGSGGTVGVVSSHVPIANAAPCRGRGELI